MQELNKLTSENFSARLTQANVANKKDMANFVKETDFDKKIKKSFKKMILQKSKTCTCWK